MNRIGQITESGTPDAYSAATMLSPSTGAAAARLSNASWATTDTGDSLDMDFSGQPGEATPEFQSVRFGPARQRPFEDPNLRLRTSQGHEGDNQGNTFTWSTDVLQDKKGHPLYTPGLGDTQQEFHQNAEGNWDYHARLQPAGGMGHYASVKLTESGSVNGDPPTCQTGYRTVDTRTGEEMRLSHMLSPQDFEAVVHGIRDAQGQVPQAQDFSHNDELLRQQADQSFAIYHGQDGQYKLGVAIPGNKAMADGAVAEYTFNLPESFHPQ